MKKPTLLEIKNAMLRLGMKVFEKDYDCTLGGIRDSDPYSNTFNDYLFIMYHEKGELKGEVVEGTVDAGLGSRLNPPHPDGVAILAHSYQNMRCYQYQNPAENSRFTGHKGREAFRQIDNMFYKRDNNKDAKADFGGELLFDLFNTNLHDMGSLGKTVDDWSWGCPGGTLVNVRKLFKIARLQRNNGLGDIFSYAQLHEYDVFPAWQKEGCNLY